MLIDTHAHLTMDQFGDIDNVLERARSAGVELIINASFDLDSSIKSASLAERHKELYAAVGIHPHHAETADEKALNDLRTLAASPKVIAIGETGLDYFENPVPKEVQRRAYIKHLQLAKELDLPVILHGRAAGDEMLEVLKEEGAGTRGVFHCFSEDTEYAKKVLDIGFYISFTGIITYKNAEKMRDVVRMVPLDRLLIETDCPYLAPQIYRGQRNEPAYVTIVAQKVAELKNRTLEEISEATTRSAKTLFNIN